MRASPFHPLGSGRHGPASDCPNSIMIGLSARAGWRDIAHSVCGQVLMGHHGGSSLLHSGLQ